MTHNLSLKQNTDHVMQLIEAVAKRDANVQDLAAQLMLKVLAANEKCGPRHRRSLERPIDIRNFAKPTPIERVAKIIHRVPMTPFILNGTLYDPKDIGRFNGRELHFLIKDGELIAFDTRQTIARIWEILYTVTPKSDPDPVPHTAPLIPPAGAPEGDAGGPYWPDVSDIGTYFYDDSGADGWGSELFLRPNRGYYDLTEVGHGFLGAGDWNDVISAYRCNGTNVCVLYEDIHYQGNTFTSTNGVSFKELNSVGWNDRASSLGTW